MHIPDATTVSQLASKAGCSMEEMLKYVARDGVTATIEDVREATAANAELDTGRGIPRIEAMRRGRAIIEYHARKQKRAP